MGLGNCRACAGQMAVVSRWKEDKEGRIVDDTGRPIPTRDDGSLSGRPAREARVQCGQCGVPDPEHPYLAEIAAFEAKARAAEKKSPPQAPAPVYGQASELAAVSGQIDKLLGAVGVLAARVAALEARLPARQEKAEKR